ncbi:hypothetical protein PPHE_b0427 [Pseudoalteromonas phenolica O-BC30]|nr:hypothetical protein [Pseudoalteromonas phenolica O-BC30]
MTPLKLSDLLLLLFESTAINLAFAIMVGELRNNKNKSVQR